MNALLPRYRVQFSPRRMTCEECGAQMYAVRIEVYEDPDQDRMVCAHHLLPDVLVGRRVLWPSEVPGPAKADPAPNSVPTWLVQS